MSCSCIKGEGSKFDINLDMLDCQTLYLTDLSNWNTGGGYELPTTYSIKVTLPTSNKEVTIEVKPQESTILKGEDLEVGECFPDGIYCFSTESCGVIYTRNKAITCLTECRIERLTEKLAKQEVRLDKYVEITNYLTIIKSSAESGQPKKAAELYKILQKELDNLDCECSCK